MIPVGGYEGKRVAVLGLGKSGIVTGRALAAGGADVLCWDDNPITRDRAGAAGMTIRDLHDPAAWAGVQRLITSPGIPHLYPQPNPVITKAWDFGVPVDNDIGLFFEMVETWRLAALRELGEEAGAPEIYAPGVASSDVLTPMEAGPKVVCITGSNGKSTTTALIGHVLAEAGRPVQVGGNIGRAVLDLDPPADRNTVYVLELSSYQTDLARILTPDIAVFLNMSPDHYDRHGGPGGYFAAKRRLFDPLGPLTAVIGVDETEGRFLANLLRFEAESSTPVTEISAQAELVGARDSVYVRGEDLIERRAGSERAVFPLAAAAALRGRHNWQNAAAAYAVTAALGLDASAISAGFCSFAGLSHRMEAIGTFAGITFVNDSKATNADAAEKALVSYDRIRWIAGGRSKEGGIASLTPHFGRIVKAYLIGEAAEPFAGTLGSSVDHEMCGTLDQAVLRASEDAQPGEVVLLSPACASWDQFASFEARGDRFRNLVLALPMAASANAQEEPS